MTQEPSVQDTQELAGDEETGGALGAILEDAAKSAFIRAQSVYRADHDHFPLKSTWETTSEQVRDGWRDIAYAALEAAYMPPLGTQPEPRLPRDVRSALTAAPPPATSSAMEALREPTDEELVALEEAVPALASFMDRDNSPSYLAWKFVAAALQAGTGVAVKAPLQNSPETADETRGGLPVAAASETAEETGRTSAYTIGGRHGTPHGSGVTAGETAPLAPVQQAGAESELVEPVAWRSEWNTRTATTSALFSNEGNAHSWAYTRDGATVEPLYSAASLSQLQQRIAGLEAERTGNRNDREWSLIGFGETPAEALSRARSFTSSIQEKGKPDGFAADRQMLFEAASDPSLSDGAVRALCLARSSEITQEDREWASAALKGEQ